MCTQNIQNYSSVLMRRKSFFLFLQLAGKPVAKQQHVWSVVISIHTIQNLWFHFFIIYIGKKCDFFQKCYTVIALWFYHSSVDVFKGTKRFSLVEFGQCAYLTFCILTFPSSAEIFLTNQVTPLQIESQANSITITIFRKSLQQSG